MNAAAAAMIATLAGLGAVSAALSGVSRTRRAVDGAGITPPTTPLARGGSPAEHAGAVYFGTPWDAPALDGATQAPTPVGRQCATCGVPIVDGDQGWLRPALRPEGGRTVAEIAAQHRECELLGIVGHTFGACDCYGFDTSRASALELWRHIHHHRSAETENDHG